MTQLARARVAIIGTGFSGLGMAIRLKQAGITDFVVLERAGEVGGTWRDNTYPGAACDVPSHLYSFSFAPNPHWRHSFSAQPQIQEYLRDCASRFGVRPHIEFDAAVRESRWDDDERVWRMQTTRGEVVADVLIAGVGGLSEPAWPDLPGLSTFAGAVFHTAQWRHDHDLAGERVAVVGTGASSVQVVPEIQPVVAQLDVYQRTAPWIIPRVNRTIRPAEQRLYAWLPLLQRLVRASIYWSHETYVLGLTRRPRLTRVAERVARRQLAAQVRDPDLRARLTPDYALGCKRVVISTNYYPALTKPNVELVTAGIREVRPHSIVTVDGEERRTDTIVLGTGFHVTDVPAAHHIRGRGGLLLADAWRDGASAYAGCAVAGFPNFFMLTGPNTGLGHTSMVVMIEAQVGYVVEALRTMTREGWATVEVRPAAQRAWTDAIQARMPRTVWSTGGCRSWYLDEHGRNTTLWPTFTFTFQRRVRRFDPAAYDVRPQPATLAQVASDSSSQRAAG